MHTIQSIESFEDPLLWPYRTMKRQQDHEASGIFVAEGDKVVRRLIDSSLALVSLLVGPDQVEEFSALIAPRPESIQLYAAPKEVLEQLTGYALYQGVLGVGRIPALPRCRPAAMSMPGPRFFAAVDGLNNAENLGVVIRNAAAFGAQALLVGETCTSPYMRRSVRNSMGAIFRMQVIFSTDLAADLRRLAAGGFRCVAAHPHTDRRVLSQAKLDGDCCIVFGSEGDGLRAEVLDACDEWVVVPMHHGVDSLNVGSASSVFLYEAARQRGRA